MDGVIPTNDCWKQSHNGGGVWISSTYIRNRGEVTPETLDWDLGWQKYNTDNVPPTLLYVRVENSAKKNGKPVFYINGYETPRLILTCGKKYQFNINTIGFPFFFTTDPVGGCNKDNVTNIPPSEYDNRTYTITHDFPKIFYYQSSLYPGMGGQVIVV